MESQGFRVFRCSRAIATRSNQVLTLYLLVVMHPDPPDKMHKGGRRSLDVAASCRSPLCTILFLNANDPSLCLLVAHSSACSGASAGKPVPSVCTGERLDLLLVWKAIIARPSKALAGSCQEIYHSKRYTVVG